ncbi:MAG: HDOD domain-containing protein [Armatimonadetes bacterium]|nr:HDOD domain-containing protein [Armatimonadota bacterium]
MFGQSSGKVDLPSMPATLARIIQVTNSPSATSEQLANVVKFDQSLSTKVLRLANSAFLGRRVKAATITEAVVTLGFSSIRNLAASASVVEALFPRRMFVGFSWRDMWTHSVTCAVSAEAIYSAMGCRGSSESAFVAGLLHDIGKLIIARALPQRFLQVVSAVRDYNFEMIRAENNILSTTHYQIGGDLAKQWDFPEMLCAAIAHHHSPEDALEYEELARAVYAANLLAKRLSKNYITGVSVNVSIKDVADAAGLDPRDINMIIDQVKRRLLQCGDILSWGDSMPDIEKAA